MGTLLSQSQDDEGEGVTLMESHHSPQELLRLPPSHPTKGEQNQDNGGGGLQALPEGRISIGRAAGRQHCVAQGTTVSLPGTTDSEFSVTSWNCSIFV